MIRAIGVVLACLMTFLVIWSACSGWVTAACNINFLDGLSWGLLTVIVLPFAFPPAAAILVLPIIICPALLWKQLNEPKKIAKIMAWGIALIGLAYVALYLISKLVGATQRCSFGF